MDAIDEHLQRYPASPIVLDVLGTLDPDEIRARVVELDSMVEEVFFFAASVGALFGVRRRDGSRVAMKVHKLSTEACYLDAVQRMQGALAADGFPAPQPLGRNGTVTWEAWLDRGSFRDAHDPDARRAMAQTLVVFHRRASATEIRPHRAAGDPIEGSVWPAPHNVLFDFEATQVGAEWIDDIGRAALPLGRGDIGDVVVGHTDWSSKHVRFDDELQASAVYDWDSVSTDREPTLVGSAAANFTYIEELDRPTGLWPSAEESLAFIDDYERARGTPFSPEERRAARAACVYLRAYATRCHHAFGGDARTSDLQEVADMLLSVPGPGASA